MNIGLIVENYNSLLYYDEWIYEIYGRIWAPESADHSAAFLYWKPRLLCCDEIVVSCYSIFAYSIYFLSIRITLTEM